MSVLNARSIFVKMEVPGRFHAWGLKKLYK